MKAGLATREPAILERWQSDNLYEKIQELRRDAPLYVLHDGPPFANGDVHMGTALNKILKDLVIKSRTMLGFRAPFVPGWDCHGLPIEFKVVKESRGLSPVEVRKKSEEYARKFIDLQRSSFKRLGVLGDWEHPYLTLSPGYEAAIIRSFGRFVEAGLVYRSKKPVLWSTGAQTALAEAEVEYQEKTSPAVFVRFALEETVAGHVASAVIWTTTPWTLPANLAIAVHPAHRYVVAATIFNGEPANVIIAEALQAAFTAATGLEIVQVLATVSGSELVGLSARHPFLDRTAGLYAGDFVTLDAGTGLVHIAPGHGEDDFLLGKANGLDLLSPVDDLGRYTGEVGVPGLEGKNVFAANEDIIALLQERGALMGRQAHIHSYPHCWRSKTPVIFRAVEQFFIRIDGIRETALAEVDRVSWLPHWGRNRIRGTVESRPDWCISRQRAWGVPLPVFYSPEGVPILDPAVIARVAELVAEKGTNVWFEMPDADLAAAVGLPEGVTHRNDTLDVWIDSGVSHEAVCRTHPALRFPADLYLEATDQHRGWFQSSLITSVALNGVAPYDRVLTHGFVVDLDGKKISKSAQGGYSKPTDADHFVKKHGADLVRLWVASVDFTDDVPFSEEIFTRLGDVYRRVRNTLRILLANLHDYDASRPVLPEDYTLIDRWTLSRLAELNHGCRDAYERLEFTRVYHALVQFCSADLSSIYIDITKDRLYCDESGSGRRRATQAVMRRCFEDLTRLLAPILAFTAEEAWGVFDPASSVHMQEFPAVCDAVPEVIGEVECLLRLRGCIAQEMDVAKKTELLGNSLEAKVKLIVSEPEDLQVLSRYAAELEEFFILSELEVVPGDHFAVEISRTTRVKCERCWRHRADVGEHAEHPTLCGRCTSAVAAAGVA